MCLVTLSVVTAAVRPVGSVFFCLLFYSSFTSYQSYFTSNNSVKLCGDYPLALVVGYYVCRYLCMYMYVSIQYSMYMYLYEYVSYHVCVYMYMYVQYL